LTLPGLELAPSVVQTVARCYTDCAAPASLCIIYEYYLRHCQLLWTYKVSETRFVSVVGYEGERMLLSWAHCRINSRSFHVHEITENVRHNSHKIIQSLIVKESFICNRFSNLKKATTAFTKKLRKHVADSQYGNTLKSSSSTDRSREKFSRVYADSARQSLTK
jgi:hypothetical protein